MNNLIKKITSKITSDNVVVNRFISGAFWAVFGNVVIRGLSLIASVFIARFLGNVSFGELAIIKTTLSVFSLMATFGLGLTITKYIAQVRKKNFQEVGVIISAANKITIITGSFFGLVIIFFAPYISEEILESNNLATPLRISGVYLFFNAMNVYQIGVIGGLEAFKKMAKINVIVGVTSFPIIIITTYLLGLNGTLIGLTLGLILNWGLNKRLINKEILDLGIKVKQKASFEYIKKILKFSYPLALSEGVYAFSNWLLLYLLLVKTNYGDVGVFNSANHWAQMILFLPGAISNVLLSFLSNQEGDKKNYNQILKFNLIFNVLITFVLAVIFSVGSSMIFDFYGESFVNGQEVLVILVFATIPMTVINVLEQVCISKSRTKLVLYFKLVRQAILLIFAYILITKYKDANALALSWLFGYGITLIIMVAFLYRKRMLKD